MGARLQVETAHRRSKDFDAKRESGIFMVCRRNFANSAAAWENALSPLKLNFYTVKPRV